MSNDNEGTWTRPQRPADGAPPRWPWVAFWSVLVSLAVGVWFAFGPEDSLGDDPVGEPSVGVPAERTTILHASWGAVDDAPPAPEAPEPREPTEWQQRERAFQEMGQARWKGTEIFVRRTTR